MSAHKKKASEMAMAGGSGGYGLETLGRTIRVIDAEGNDVTAVGPVDHPGTPHAARLLADALEVCRLVVSIAERSPADVRSLACDENSPLVGAARMVLAGEVRQWTSEDVTLFLARAGFSPEDVRASLGRALKRVQAAKSPMCPTCCDMPYRNALDFTIACPACGVKQ
jgi:hypothetical protein